MEMNNMQKWAPFPKDDATFSEFEEAITKVKSLGSLTEARGLHSNSSTERSNALYGFVMPLHIVVTSIGKTVELPIVLPGKNKKIGREAAGFFCEAKSSFNLEGLNIASVTFVATIDSLVIGSLTEGEKVSRVFLNVSLPNSGRNSLVLIGQEIDPKCFIDTEPGSVLDPEGLNILEKLLISSAHALAESI